MMTEISRRDFLKTAALVLSSAGLTACLPEEKQPRSFKERVLSFRWEQAKGKELEDFTNDLADEYLRLTKTVRSTKTDLTGVGRTNYFSSRDIMVKAIRELIPDFTPTSTQWGYTEFKTRKVFIDLDTLRRQTAVQARNNNLDPEQTAGMALLDALWHEWGHVDVTERGQGELINNPQYFFRSPVSGKDEQFRRYRGAEVFTDTYYGLLRFEEVLNETITVRRMVEQAGLETVFSSADYYPNGVDFFPLFSSATGIKLAELYQLHASSDFEGIVKLVGSKLPGNGNPLEKGSKLAVGIHQSDPQLIQQTGVYNLLPQSR